VLSKALWRFAPSGMYLLAQLRRPPAQWDAAAVTLEQVRRDAKEPLAYPNYLYGLLAAARTASAARVEEFSTVEFGVAGGNGLVALERHAATVERYYPVRIRTFGFDAGSGLPPSRDPRDCPFAFPGGEFAMDQLQLKARLQRSELFIGDVHDTVSQFCEKLHPPVGFVSNDLDLYTSTRDSFALYELGPDRLLPRVTLYFDDLHGYPYTTASGEWAAIHDFNAAFQKRQIGYVSGLKHTIGGCYRFAPWAESFFVLHVFDHPAYAAAEAADMPSMALAS
jgi:hypothetical protein